jgi:competence ComEA-like helix-hairpin-helix protein
MYTGSSVSVADRRQLMDQAGVWNQTLISLFLLLLIVLLGTIPVSRPISGPEYGIAGTRSAEPSGKLNLNTAEWYELAQLPGVGEGLARRIIEYRKNAGRPLRVHDLIAVKGIGRRTLERISPHLYANSN